MSRSKEFDGMMSAQTLRSLAADVRFDSMPAKFRWSLEWAADRIDEMFREREKPEGDCRSVAPNANSPRTPQSDRLNEWERHGSHRWGLGVASDLYDLECRVAAMETANNTSTGVPATDLERFHAAVMNWISEATSVYASSCQNDGGRKIMADACMRCWAQFGHDTTDLDAAPAARAVSTDDRTDKAAPSQCRDRPGDTPVTEPMPVGSPGIGSVTLTDAELEALEFVVERGHVACGYEREIVRGLLERLR